MIRLSWARRSNHFDTKSGDFEQCVALSKIRNLGYYSARIWLEFESSRVFMKSVLIFTTCLVLMFTLGGDAKTKVRGFDLVRDSQLVMTDFPISPTCLASTFISEYDESKSFRNENMTVLYLINKHDKSSSSI